MTDLRELTEKVIAFRDARDWAQFHSPKNLSMALACEAAEIMDLFRWSTEIESRQVSAARIGGSATPDVLAKLTDEVADIGVFLLALCHEAGIDLRAAILSKLARSETRYPVEQCRGRADKWTAYR